MAKSMVEHREFEAALLLVHQPERRLLRRIDCGTLTRDAFRTHCEEYSL